ncbi:MAG: glycosyl transferase family 1 [Elusimicrobia bacterium RIFCSPLOWO2_01_FULL_60_11]|nr:MAG: glycosyl transferase family 1 [Elusimicrobia bacterium RIFCSPLOWO2_01_FULL_60_11]
MSGLSKNGPMRKIAFIGNYLPRQCGIATFTTDVCASVAARFPKVECFALPVNDTEAGYDYPKEVRFEIEEQDLGSYQRAADFLSLSDVDVVCVQHEFGIFGGPAGGHILALLREVRLPIVTTLHTVLKDPNPEQKRVMQELIRLSTRLVVMSQKGREFLKSVYKAPESKIDVIPHGIPDIPFVESDSHKDLFGVEGRRVLLTFGLLSPNKGIENVLNALPKIAAEFPDVVYIVLGATHPHLVREQGDVYRLSLELLAKKNNIEKNVIFYNRFVEIGELKEFIQAADIYVTPYLNEAQIVSGTLAYCFGAGKAIVSTPYWYAKELLAQDRGVLVPFNDSDAIAREVLGLLRDGSRSAAMRGKAYEMGREMVWSKVACAYMRSFELARVERASHTRKLFTVKTLDRQLIQLPEIKLDHLFRMTDSTGLFQHAVQTVPNFSTGYCTDDNARALILTVLLEELGEDSLQLRNAASTYAAFIRHAFDPRLKRFRNCMDFGRSWTAEEISEDSCGRALWALGTCVGRSNNPSFQNLAGQIFGAAIVPIADFSSPRAWAMALIGTHEYLRRFSGDRLVSQLRETLTNRLMGLYERSSAKDWPWFEDSVTYMNAKLPHALILSGRWTERPDVFEAGLKTLRWLMDVQTAEGGYFRPIGSNGFYKRGGPRANFDQQPIEAHATVSACLEAYRATSDDFWFAAARRAFDWFLGRNDLGVLLYDPNSGGCRDGLHLDRVNQNQGAESTLAFLLSLAEMRQAQHEMAAFNPAPALEKILV